MMQIYEIPHPNLDIYVQFKVLDTAEASALGSKLETIDDTDAFIRAVLEATVPNLKSEVTEKLRKLSKAKARVILDSLFNGCIMLNPGLDINHWIKMTSPRDLVVEPKKKKSVSRPKTKTRKISKAQFLNLERHLKTRVIGQDQALQEVVSALKRSQAGLADEQRPIGVFLFAGASGVGKTWLARELHKYLYGDTHEMVRIDCGEYQHKHENAKLIGAPPGYLGYDDGGQLTNVVKKNPNTVVLLDEVEKAHPDFWHTFLRVFDEGKLTDGSGEVSDFRNTIIIMTTNLGNRKVVEDTLNRTVGFGRENDPGILPKREKMIRLAQEEIRKTFTPELINRIDKTVVFNHLTNDDFEKIAELELSSIDSKLAKRGFAVTFDDEVVRAMVADGMTSVQGARKLSQVRRDAIENKLADTLLQGRFPRGTVFQILHRDDDYTISAQRPKKALNIVEE